MNTMFTYREALALDRPDRCYHYDPPPYAPNVVNQTVSYNGATWKGNPGSSWTLQSSPEQNTLNDSQAKIDAQNAATKQANDARFTQDKADLTDFNNRFSTAVPQIISNTSQKYNLGGLLSIANGLGNRVSELSGNTMGTGAGGYASSDQVDKAVQTNYLPRYEQAVNNLNQGTQLAQNEESTLMTPYTTNASLLNDRMARETTAYTAEQQQQLESLIQQMNAGVQLTTTQMNNANALAQKQLEYEQALKSMQMQNQYKLVPAGNTLINTFNGQTYAAH